MVDISKFKTWVASQPAEKTYDYSSTGTDPSRQLCALGQYLQEQFPENFPVVEIGRYRVHAERDQQSLTVSSGRVSKQFDRALSGSEDPFYNPAYNEADWTFGKLAARLELVDA